MARLLEHEVFAAVLGEIVDQDHLSQLCTHKGVGKDSYSDCEEYNISHKSYFEDPVLSKMFKITECIPEFLITSIKINTGIARRVWHISTIPITMIQIR